MEDLPPLQHHVDADALDALVTSMVNGDGVLVTFEHEGFEVTVDGREGVQLRAVSVDRPAPPTRSLGRLGDRLE